MSVEDNTERFELWKRENITTPPSLSQASLLLSRLQQSLRLLSGDLNHDSLRKVLKSVGRETKVLTQILTAKELTLTSWLSASLGKLALDLSGTGKPLDASTLRTMSYAIDCLRGYNTEKAVSLQSQRLPIYVLMLDDDAVFRKVMEQALGVEFINLTICDTAEAALSRLTNLHFDVILSDISMPEVDGFAFIQRLRQIKMHADTPVVFVTGLDDLVTRSKSRLTGGCDLIAKPIKPAELIVKVVAFAWKSRLSRDPEGVESTSESSPSNRPKSGGEAALGRPSPGRVGVLSISSEGWVKTINRDGASMLGYSAEEMQNKEAARFLAELSGEGEAKGLTTDRLADLAKGAIPTPVRVICKTGEICLAQMRVSRSGIGAAAPFVCVLTVNPDSTGSAS